MKIIKKLFLIPVLGIFSFNSFASDLEVKLNGSLDFWFGYNSLGNKKPLLENSKKSAFNSSASVGLVVSNTLDSGVTYGAEIGLRTTANSARRNSSFIFVEHDNGRVEFGSGKSVLSKMSISAFRGSCGSAGGWDTWIITDPDPSKSVPFVACNAGFLDTKSRTKGESEYARKISFYTAKISDFQFGVSYINTTSNPGYTSYTNSKDISFTHVYNPDFRFNIKDGFALAATYDRQIFDSVNLSLSAATELGKVKAIKNYDEVVDKNFKNLKSYSLGAKIDISDLTILGSFTDHKKSFMPTSEDKRTKSRIYTIGAIYKFGKFSTSLTNFHSNHRGNKVNATSLGVDYKGLTGMVNSFEIVNFKVNGTALDNSRSVKHSGNIFLLGTKILF